MKIKGSKNYSVFQHSNSIKDFIYFSLYLNISGPFQENYCFTPHHYVDEVLESG